MSPGKKIKGCCDGTRKPLLYGDLQNKTGHENEEVSVMQKNWGEQFGLMLALWKKLVFKNM